MTKIILKGRTSLLKPIITHIMAIHQLIDEKDMGMIIENPIEEHLRNAPRDGITLQCHFTTYKRPPFYPLPNKRFLAKRITIPNVNRALLSYESIRKACGGKEGLDWGECSARTYLTEDNNPRSIRRMMISGSTQRKAVENLKRFIPFTTLKPSKITSSITPLEEDINKNNTDIDQLTRYEVYPHYISIINNRLIQHVNKNLGGKRTLAGRQLMKSCKLNIYMEQEPTDWNTKLQTVLQRSFPGLPE